MKARDILLCPTCKHHVLMPLPLPQHVSCPCDLLVRFRHSAFTWGTCRYPVSKYSSVFIYSSDLYGKPAVCQALCWVGYQGEACKAEGVPALKDWHCSEGGEQTSHDPAECLNGA